MKCIILIGLILLSSNSYAQKIIPFNADLEDKLIEYIIAADGISEDFIEQIKDLNWCSMTTDSIEVFAEPLLIKNLSDEMPIEAAELTCKFGLFQFYCPLVMPLRPHLMLKNKDEIMIIEDNDIISQTEVLINYFKEDDDIPRVYFSTFMKYLIKIHDDKKLYVE